MDARREAQQMVIPFASRSKWPAIQSVLLREGHLKLPPLHSRIWCEHALMMSAGLGVLVSKGLDSAITLRLASIGGNCR